MSTSLQSGRKNTTRTVCFLKFLRNKSIVFTLRKYLSAVNIIINWILRNMYWTNRNMLHYLSCRILVGLLNIK